MKVSRKWIVIILSLFIFPTHVHAASPKEDFALMVGELQKAPTDSALREKVINFAQTLKPAPAVPVEAEKFEGRAQYAFKNAKSEAELLDAAREYLKAVDVAPWTAGYYYDLCTILEKANKPAEAINACKFYLVAAPAAPDAGEVRKRIAGLEYAIERIRGNVTQRAECGTNLYDIYEGNGKITQVGASKISLQLASTLYAGVWRNQIIISDITASPNNIATQRFDLTPIDSTFRLEDRIEGTPYFRLTIGADGGITFGSYGAAQAEIITSTSELLQSRVAHLNKCAIGTKNGKFYVSIAQGGSTSPRDGSVVNGRLFFESNCAGKLLGEKPGWTPAGLGPHPECPQTIVQQLAEWAPETFSFASADACLASSSDGLGWLASS